VFNLESSGVALPQDAPEAVRALVASKAASASFARSGPAWRYGFDSIRLAGARSPKRSG